MNPNLITLNPTLSSAQTKTILAKDGFQCSIILLEPGTETSPHEPHATEEHLLYAVEGEATVRFGEINLILNADDAVLIPKGQSHRIAAGASQRAKILRVEVPPRQVVTPQILTINP